MISMIASVGKNRELGKKNGLVWRISADMKYFKNTTMGHKVIMGYNTYKSLPGDLPGREMIVLSKKKIEGNVETIYSVDDVLNKYLDCKEEVFICGGASLYNQFIEYANKLYLTEIMATDSEADTFFPGFNKRKYNKTILDTGEDKGIKYKMCLYEKKH